MYDDRAQDRKGAVEKKILAFSGEYWRGYSMQMISILKFDTFLAPSNLSSDSLVAVFQSVQR